MPDVMRNWFLIYRRCMALINCEHGVGAAFFIGGGYWVTARHVVEEDTVTSITDYSHGEFLPRRVFFPADDGIDLAVLETDYSIPEDPSGSGRDYINLQAYGDRWVDDNLILSPVLLMGYPDVPESDEYILVAYASHINAVIERSDHLPFRHLVLFGMAKHGFSGGPVLDRNGSLLGICNFSSKEEEDDPAELGFLVATGVEPLLNLLRDNRIEPGQNTPLLHSLFPEYYG